MLKKYLDLRLLLSIILMGVLFPAVFHSDNLKLSASLNEPTPQSCYSIRTKNIMAKCFESYFEKKRKECNVFPNADLRANCNLRLEQEINAEKTKAFKAIDNAGYFNFYIALLLSMIGARFIYWFAEWRKPF